MRLLKMSNLVLLFLLFVVNGALQNVAMQNAHAQNSLRPLTAAEIQSFVFGTMMTGEYPSGQQWAERFGTDGSSNYSQNGIISRGVMKLDGNILCFSYPRTDQSGGCFEVWKRSKNCFDFYATPTTVPMMKRRFGQNWDARAWYSNQPGTCVSEQVS